ATTSLVVSDLVRFALATTSPVVGVSSPRSSHGGVIQGIRLVVLASRLGALTRTHHIPILRVGGQVVERPRLYLAVSGGVASPRLAWRSGADRPSLRRSPFPRLSCSWRSGAHRPPLRRSPLLALSRVALALVLPVVPVGCHPRADVGPGAPRPGPLVRLVVTRLGLGGPTHEPVDDLHGSSPGLHRVHARVRGITKILIASQALPQARLTHHVGDVVLRWGTRGLPRGGLGLGVVVVLRVVQLHFRAVVAGGDPC